MKNIQNHKHQDQNVKNHQQKKKEKKKRKQRKTPKTSKGPSSIEDIKAKTQASIEKGSCLS